ncbi:MAG: hypothetical protein ACREI4_02715 [Candidatus Rokuibacteriota bacterium]
MVTTIGAAAVLLLSAGGTLAQARLGQLSDSSLQPVDAWMVAGKVVDLDRRPDMVTMLKLDNGTSLRLTQESAGPGQRVQVGDSIVARFEETGTRDKVATLVRVIETQAP